MPHIELGHYPTLVEEMSRLRDALGGGPRLLSGDDTIPFGFGGNKVRKLPYVLAEAMAQGADTIITCGGVQSNHARATTAAAVHLGLAPVLVANGEPQDRPTGNALLVRLMGAEVHYVASREERSPRMEALAEEYRARGRRPYVIPLGASTALGAMGFVRAVGELLDQAPSPDVIVHACSSGGTQAGLAAGLALHGLDTPVIGVMPTIGPLRWPRSAPPSRALASCSGGRDLTSRDAAGSRSATTASAKATASRRPPRSKRRPWRPAPRRSSSTTPTPPRRSAP
jgi:1-aminocyclopropane-1-carboxylate deaminase/D-cysteine desulfhydrase-like pyridoxal-dependent ACC family enzyme